jgi:hypothetical protein
VEGIRYKVRYKVEGVSFRDYLEVNVIITLCFAAELTLPATHL